MTPDLCGWFLMVKDQHESIMKLWWFYQYHEAKRLQSTEINFQSGTCDMWWFNIEFWDWFCSCVWSGFYHGGFTTMKNHHLVGIFLEHVPTILSKAKQINIIEKKLNKNTHHLKALEILMFVDFHIFFALNCSRT